MRVFFVLGLMAALAGCSNKDAIAFDGVVFKAKVKTVRADRRAMTVTVKKASASLDGAREAGGYEAIKYCIKTVGKSEIDWLNGPDAPIENLLIAGDSLVLTGSCTG